MLYQKWIVTIEIDKFNRDTATLNILSQKRPQHIGFGHETYYEDMNNTNEILNNQVTNT